VQVVMKFRGCKKRRFHLVGGRARWASLVVVTSVAVSGCAKSEPSAWKETPVESTKTTEDNLPKGNDAVAEPQRSKPMPRSAAELVRARNELDKTVWANELVAQRHEQTFVNLWDRLLKEPDKYGVLEQFPLKSVIVGTEPKTKQLDWGITSTRYEGGKRSIDATQWPTALAAMKRAGYEIVETEWHHLTFELGTADAPARSTVSFLLHVVNKAQDARYIVRGKLGVTWATTPDPNATSPENHFAQAGDIDATDVTVLARSGPPPFTVESKTDFPRDPRGIVAPQTFRPLILHDLNDDGLPELVITGANQVWWNRGEWKFEPANLCAHAPGPASAGIFADFNGDGVTDYLVGVKQGLPRLYAGQPGGSFPDPPRVLAISKEQQPYPTGFTAGDIDGDGDLDVFLGQLKPAYESGDIPTPYFNCNDSWPSVLMINDGRGHFHDGTEAAGLGAKRNRRNFSASLVDIDDDGDLDLLLSSDFAGADLFRNDGQGHFTDATDRIEPAPYAFGMAHTFGDYDGDGRLDFLITGMSSTTARRLEQMKLRREDFGDYDARRMDMGYGNRLYLNRGDHFEQAPFNSTVARTGWSWGTTTLDFDNDADQDIYIVNGQISGATTRDYCTRFWCHDVYYREGERPDAAVRELFQKLTPLFNGRMLSWNGYEHNALLMNLGKDGFVNVGFLMGVAFEFDSRAALSGDLDGDGRVDLVVEEKDHRGQLSRLYLVRNNWQGPGHWIGVHLRQPAPGTSPLGAKVSVELDDGRKLLQHNVSGHSVWVQHPNTVHFGLGDQPSVKSLTVTWPDGRTSRLENPAVDRYHVVAVPSGG